MSIRLYKDAVTGVYKKNNDSLPQGQFILFQNDGQTQVGLRTLAGVTIIDLQPFGNITDEGGTPYASITLLEEALAGFFDVSLQHGGMSLTGAPIISLPVADVWVKIVGNWVSTPSPKGFTVDNVNDRLIHTGKCETSYLFNGASDALVSKNSKLTYGLFANGESQPRVTTEHDYSNANSVSQLAATGILDLCYNDYMEVWAKSDTLSNSLTPKSLDITLWGAR